MNVVYWIRLQNHFDISKEGYVGVTSDYKKRMEQHSSKTKKLNCHFANAIIKYGWDNLIKEIVFEGNKDECFKKEKELRPHFQIGWNDSVGGFGGDRSKFIDYENRLNKGWNYDKTKEKNPFWQKKHSIKSLKKMSKTKCRYIVKTPDGTFYGFRDAARFYKINKITARLWCGKKEGWSYESK